MATLFERYVTPYGTHDAMYKQRYFAQTFTVGNTGPNKSHNIVSVKLYLRYVDAQWNFIVSIRAVDGAGLPTGPDLVSTIYTGALSLGTAWVEITLPPYLLAANTKYAIVVGAPDAPGGGGGIVEWSRANASGYGGGSWCYSTDWGVSWGTNLSRDYAFYEYGFFTAKCLKTIETKNETALNAVSKNETALDVVSINE